jgi:transcriptional regulator with XRE-family HTH domain
MADPEARTEYESFKLQLDLAQNMKHLREEHHLTQEEIAEKMHTTKSTIARLEAAGGRSKHSPSLKTLAKYANALGYTLEINLKPALKR